MTGAISARPPSEDGRLAAFMAAVVAVPAGLVVAAGAVSALAFGRGWTLPPSMLWPTVIEGTVTHLGRPAAGWPPPFGARLPGPGPFWATYGSLALAAAVLAAAVAATLGGRHPRAGRDGRARPAQLRTQASVRSARRLKAHTRPGLAAWPRPAPIELGYPLGRSHPGGVKLWASWEASTRVVAPPGAGKTYRVLARIVRSHPGPVIATSTKADLCQLTVAARRRGDRPVVCLDPEGLCGSAGIDPVRWSPVAGCDDTMVAERRAIALLAATGDRGDERHGRFFINSARDVLKAYLHAAALCDGDISTVLGWSRRIDDPTPAEILRCHPDAAPGWADIIALNTSGAAETTSGVMRHLAQALACFSHRAVIDACCPPPGQALDIADTLGQCGTIYVLGKEAGLGAMAPLLTAFTQQVFDTAETLANARPAGRLDPPLLGALDEVAAIAPIPTLPVLLADGRGRGITIVFALQSFSQAVDRWGAAQAETMANATAITVVFGGLTSAKDLSELERICGTHDIRRKIIHQGGAADRRSATHQTEHVPVLRVGELRTLPEGTALMLWGRLPPFLAAFAPLHADPHYRRELHHAARGQTPPIRLADRSQPSMPLPAPTGQARAGSLAGLAVPAHDHHTSENHQ
jgi:type IV secretory pathway TraG/TraD family ATPase VirD4